MLRSPLLSRQHLGSWVLALLSGLLPLTATNASRAHTQRPRAEPQPVVIDTDIGDDIDDAFALGLALSSPELKILGITASWGDTALRARLLDRLLIETGHLGIPVAVGPVQHHAGEGSFSQSAWAKREPPRAFPGAVDLLLTTIRQHPDTITLIALSPLTTIAAAIDRDPATFRRLHRIVMMGGSIHRGYGDLGYLANHGPEPEYNIAMDAAAARKVFASGVPIYLMPLDSTQIPLDEAKRRLLFAASTPLNDSLTLLYQQWARATNLDTPTMFDPVAVAFTVNPAVCPVNPMRLIVSDDGFTREQSGTPNAFVCLQSNTDAFFELYMSRLLSPLSASAAPN